MNTHRRPGPARAGRIITDPATRRWLYGIAVALVPLLVSLGALAPGAAGLVLTLAGAVLGMSTAGLAAVNTPPAGGGAGGASSRTGRP